MTDDFGQDGQTFVFCQQPQETELVGRQVAGNFGTQLRNLLMLDARVAQQTMSRRAGHDSSQPRQRIGPMRQRLRTLCQLEGGFGVRTGDGERFGHGRASS